MAATRNRKKANWVTVGKICVDAGLVWIGDPCYILHEKKLPKSLGKDWGDFCKKLGRACPTTKSFLFNSGHEGLGVCAASGVGDGAYDVEALIEEVPRMGKRVCAVKVTFIKPSERRRR
jgi:hypothetical protein